MITDLDNTCEDLLQEQAIVSFAVKAFVICKHSFHNINTT